MASKTRVLMKRLDPLGYGQSWVRSLGMFSKSKPPSKKPTDKLDGPEDPPLEKWGPEQEKNALNHGKDFEHKLFLDEPIPDHFMGYDLPDPVRNTEREYFQTHQNPRWAGHAKGVFDSRFYSKKYGISKEVYAWLHWDINLNDNDEIDLWRKRIRFRMHKEDQRYLEDRVRVLGHDLAAAHFIVARGGAVKFAGREHWFVKDSNGNYSLPRKHVDQLFVEAIDASNTNLTHVAFDILEPLERVRYIKLRNCQYVDDWCLASLHRLRHSLEFLDLENCAGVTDNGISSLHCLANLRGLRLSRLPGVKHLGLLTLQLEEHLPSLTVLGVSEADLSPPAWTHRGESRRVRALLGCLDEDTDPDTFPQAQEVPLETNEDNMYVHRRLVLKAD